MGAMKNLAKAKKDLQDVKGLLNPPAVDIKKAKDDLKVAETFVDTSKTAWGAKTKKVIENLDKMLKIVENALNHMKTRDREKAANEIKKAFPEVYSALNATKQGG